MQQTAPDGIQHCALRHVTANSSVVAGRWLVLHLNTDTRSASGTARANGRYAQAARQTSKSPMSPIGHFGCRRIR